VIKLALQILWDNRPAFGGGLGFSGRYHGDQGPLAPAVSIKPIPARQLERRCPGTAEAHSGVD